MQISDDAVKFIVQQEDGSEAMYNAHYQHFEWPQGASGPTIGIGYDCGYVTKVEAALDWDGILSADMIAHVQAACGLRGSAAASFVSQHKYSVTVTWDQAMQEFKTREIPKWLSRLQHSLPNLDKLSPDSLGALVSLAYNRGCSFDLPGARFAEMREIKHLMGAQKFSLIPNEIMSMRRLWPPNGGLWNRRIKEADLFRKGLPHG